MLRARISSFGRNPALALRQRSVPPRYVVAELRPSNTPTKGASILRKDRHPRTRLLQALHTGLKTTDGHENITSMVKENLNAYIPRIKQPQFSYETVIRFLLSRDCLPAVISVYQRMTDVGYAVSLRLEAKMIVALMVGTVGVEEKVVEEWWGSLQGIVRNKGFEDEDLWSILNVMSSRDFPADLLLTTMNNFYETHEMKDSKPHFRLYKRFLHQGVESGQVEAGLQSLALLGHSQLRGPKRKLVNQAYAAFIAGVRDAPHLDRDRVGAALKMMGEQGVRPSIIVVNSLISLEVHNNSLHRAFALYDAVKHDRKLWPDDFTFGSLFNILNRLYNPKRRRVRYGRVIAGDIPSPRTLYREMMEALLRKSAGLAFEPTTSLLNVVLRSFVYKNDYVGACVVLQCFTAFRVSVNVVTYKFVFRHLVNRITYWIRAYRKMGDDKWADQFLSLPYPVLDPEFLAKLKLGVPLMVRIMDVCRRREFYLDWPLYAHKWQNHYAAVPVEYRVPSVEYILGRIPVSLDYSFDVVPLERLLRKAILCEVESMRELGYGEAALSYIAKVIAEARAEMVPDGLDKRLEEMERQREVKRQKKEERERKAMESGQAKKEVFEGFTERRKRRHAERDKAEGVTVVVEVGGSKKGAEERQEDAELPDGVVDETRINAVREDKGSRYAIAVIETEGMRSAILVNDVAWKKSRRNTMLRDRRKKEGRSEGGVEDS